VLTPEGADRLARELDAMGVDLPIDWEHATELRAPQGERADAAGWLSRLERPPRLASVGRRGPRRRQAPPPGC
jgi:phage I-like protein